MPNYVSTLTGQQITSVMTQIDQGVPEGWAVGEKNGIPVSSSSPYYHNNAKYYAENALDSAARAEAAVPAGTAGAVFFDRDMSSTLTASQKEQFRKNIMAGGSNRNLLDNPWFTVNQRGAVSWNNNYGIDRWAVYRATATVNADHSISLTYANEGASMYQRFTYETGLVGKLVTASILFTDGSILSARLIIPSSGTNYSQNFDQGVRFSMNTVANSYHQLAVAVLGEGNTLNIKAVKLELGSVSTLANDAPPNYAEELAKCQFNGILKLNEGHCLTGRAINAAAAVFFVPWKHRAGDSGTSYVSGLISNIYHSGGAITASTNPAKNSANTDFIRLTVTGLSGLITGEPVIGEVGANGLIVSNDF